MWNIATSRTCLRPTKYENFVNRLYMYMLTQKSLSVFFKVFYPKSTMVQYKQIASVLLCKWFMKRLVMVKLVIVDVPLLPPILWADMVLISIQMCHNFMLEPRFLAYLGRVLRIIESSPSLHNGPMLVVVREVLKEVVRSLSVELKRNVCTL